jgi:hypothetical protein
MEEDDIIISSIVPFGVVVVDVDVVDVILVVVVAAAAAEYR